MQSSISTSSPSTLRQAGRFVFLLLTICAAAKPATITIVNGDGAGKGFNDTTPVAPVGGNTGTTLGAQRLIAVQKAAQIWGATVQSSIEIKVDARFDPNPPTGLPCDANTATLGSAGAITGVIFAGGPFPNTFYPIALANALNGTDNDPGLDIRAWFNGKIDNNNNCLAGTNWYYGLDHNEGNNLDLLATAFHEIAHGLGFQNYVNLSTGAFFPNTPDIYSRFIIDSSTGKRWDQMTNGERVTSSKNCGNVVWGGNRVMSGVPAFLDLGTPRLKINSPAGIADEYKVGEAAASGAPLGSPGVTAPVQLVNDGSGTTTDGCQSLLAFVPGNIALLDRNSAVCTTVTQITNAKNAGASAALIIDSSAGCPPPGINGAGTTIPAAQISVATGNLIKGQLPSPGVNATLGLDSARRRGADPFGFAELQITDPVQTGSSISHFDVSATPSLLMEPSLMPNLTSNLDLTPYLLADIGWTLTNPADLSITKTDSMDPVPAGSPLTYTITVTNNGPNTANDVVVTDTLPAGVTFGSTSGCANDPNGVPGCNLGTIVSGLSKQFTVSVTTGASGMITNQVSVSSSTVDSNFANNTASQQTTVSLPPGADLSVTKTSNVNPVVKGNQLTYTVTVSNIGPSAATSVVATDTLPAGVTFVSSSGCSNDPNGVPTCNLGTINAGANKQYTIVVNLGPTTVGTLTNSVSVSSAITDANTANNNNSVMVEAVSLPNDQFVTQLYLDILNRQPGAGDVAFWVSKLTSGAKTREQLAVDFITSAESKNSGLFIVNSYIGLLARNPDFGGWIFWFNRLRSGVAATSIVRSFITSAEYISKFGDVDLLNNADFVNHIYMTLLGRPADPGGSNYWQAQLSGGTTREQMIIAFLMSSEFTAKQGDRATVNLLYVGFLRRPADPSGLQAWVNFLKAGNPLTSLVRMFFLSSEYNNRF